MSEFLIFQYLLFSLDWYQLHPVSLNRPPFPIFLLQMVTSTASNDRVWWFILFLCFCWEYTKWM